MPAGNDIDSPFSCAVCPRVYSKREHLQRHERSHTGARPFKCDICARTFARGDVLNRHIRVHQPARKAAGHGVSPPTTQEQILPKHQNLPQNRDHPLDSANSDAGQGEPPSHGIPPRLSYHATSALNGDVQYDDESYLLWPDSEEFLQNLMSWDATTWQPSMPVWGPAATSTQGVNDAIQSPLNDSQLYNNASTPEELSSARDGNQALHTAHGLVRDTLSSVTASPDLSNLTPRFLDSSLHMFFTNFILVFPVIHRSTFTFGNYSAPLLLHAVALGSLFLGMEDSIPKGEALWRLAHTAITTSWPLMISERGKHDSCNGVQLVLAALLGHIYAAFSRNHVLRMTSQTFSGLAMHWAQYCGMHVIDKNVDIPSINDTPEVKESAWKTWVAKETQLRVLLGICIIDGVASQFSGNPSTTWLTSNSLPLPTDEDVFNASNPDKWIHAMTWNNQSAQSGVRFCDICHPLLSANDASTIRKTRDLGLLSIRIVLEILNCLAMESNRSSPATVGIPPKVDIARALGRLRQDILASQKLTPTERSIALLRWHSVCVDMVASSASRGTRRMCHQFGLPQLIFGGERREESGIDPARWVQGQAGRKCLLHALQIHVIATQMPMGVAHDVYLAGAIFTAASIFASFALSGVSKIGIPVSIDWDTALMAGLENKADNERDYNLMCFLIGQFGRLTEDVEVHNLVYDLSSLRILLRGLSLQWGVMQEMEKVVGAWIVHCA